MSIFDNEKGQFAPDQPDQPESFEAKSRGILLNPMRLDVDEDRAEPGVADAIVGSPSIVIADILTPKGSICVLYIKKTDEHSPTIVLAGDTKDKRQFLNPSDGHFDMSDMSGEGKCIIGFTTDATDVILYATNPDSRYEFYGRIKGYQDRTPESRDLTGDPDYPSGDQL